MISLLSVLPLSQHPRPLSCWPHPEGDLGRDWPLQITAPFLHDRGPSDGWGASEASWCLLNGLVPGCLEDRVRWAAAPKHSLCTQGQAQSHPDTQEKERHPTVAASSYLSWLVSITRLTTGDSVMWACTLCWPETRDTSFSESCPAPVESSCLS